MRVLGIIPARAGSKGVPGKNSKLLNGRPLLEYTAIAAKASEGLDDLIFSSEDEALRDLARSYGIKVLFERPDELARDHSGSVEVVLHAIGFMEAQGEHFDAICLLQLTNPFRSAGFIDKAISKFKEDALDSLISVLPVPHEFNPHWVFEPNEMDHLVLSTGEASIIPRRQELPRAYYRDGSIYISSVEVLKQKHSFFGDRLGYIEADPGRHVNIDTVTDWKRAEEIAKKIYG